MRIRVLMQAASVIGTVVLAGDAFGRYAPPPFHFLAGASDLIVVGKIVRVGDGTFTLRVEEILAGSWNEAEVTAVQHLDWTCSHRWKPYQLGQREIAFLRRFEDDDGTTTAAQFRLMSIGDEAEWEIRDDRVSVQGFRLPAGEEFDDGEHPGQWVDFDLVRDALRDYRQLYAPKAVGEGRYEIERASDAAVAAYSARSFVHKYLVATTDSALARREVGR